MQVSPVRAGQETRIRLVYLQPAQVDTGIGRPDQFFDPDINGDGILDSTRYTLLPGEGQKWYRFTTLGDGELGTMIRLTPAASAGVATSISKRSCCTVCILTRQLLEGAGHDCAADDL